MCKNKWLWYYHYRQHTAERTSCSIKVLHTLVSRIHRAVSVLICTDTLHAIGTQSSHIYAVSHLTRRLQSPLYGHIWKRILPASTKSSTPFYVMVPTCRRLLPSLRMLSRVHTPLEVMAPTTSTSWLLFLGLVGDPHRAESIVFPPSVLSVSHLPSPQSCQPSVLYGERRCEK